MITVIKALTAFAEYVERVHQYGRETVDGADGGAELVMGTIKTVHGDSFKFALGVGGDAEPIDGIVGSILPDPPLITEAPWLGYGSLVCSALGEGGESGEVIFRYLANVTRAVNDEVGREEGGDEAFGINGCTLEESE